jgi:hypothetical protein
MNRTLKATAVTTTFGSLAGADLVGYGPNTAQAETQTTGRVQAQAQTVSAPAARHGHEDSSWGAGRSALAATRSTPRVPATCRPVSQSSS